MTGRFRWILAGIFALAFSIRVVAVSQYEAAHPNSGHLSIDEASYDAWAREIAGGDWIGKEAFFQEPLYPYALGALYAVAGPERHAARIVQCALWAMTAVFAGLLARRIFGTASGILAALAIALYGPGMIFPSLLLKENLALPIFTLLALALVARAWFWVGILAGLGALLRGNLLVMIPLFLLWPFLRAPRIVPIRSSALVLAGAACILLPVALRNARVGGEFLLTTSGAGTNLYGGNNLENPYGRATEFSFVRGIPEHEAGDWRREAERRTARELDPGEVSAFWRDETLRSFREHPREHLAILWNKLRLTLGRYEVPDNHFLPWDARYVSLARAPWPWFGVVGVLGLAGVALFLLDGRWGKRSIALPVPEKFVEADRGAACDVLLLGAAYVGTVVLTVVSDRARLPIVPLLAPFAAWTVLWAVNAIRERQQDALVRLAFAVAAAALPVYTRVLPDSEVAEDFAERDYNLAVQLLREGGRAREARSISERLVSAHPSSARARILLAEVDFREGRDPGGILARVEPLADETTLNARERFRAASLAAWVHLGRGAFAEAERRFREALAFDGDSLELREGLARALVGRSEHASQAEARAASEEALALLEGRDAEDPELEILRAQAEFARGRAILSGPFADDAERRTGEAAVQSALDRLHRLDGSSPEFRRRSRLVAGGIQLERGNLEAAENHFRAALAAGTDSEAQLGLLAALIGRLERGPDDPRRRAEARRLVVDLGYATRPDPRLADLAQRLDRLE